MTDVEKLYSDGFVVLHNAIPTELVDTARNSTKQFLTENESIFSKHKNNIGYYRRIVNLHCILNELRDLYTANDISLNIQDDFFGKESCIYTSLFFEVGTQQSIHRDSPYFCSKPENLYLGVWIALEDANNMNGTLSVIKYGHLVGEPDRTKIVEKSKNHSELWDNYQKDIIDMCMKNGLSIEQIPVNKGDIIIWHPQLPHGGSTIIDKNSTRYSTVFHTTAIGVPLYQMEAFFDKNHFDKLPDKNSWAYKNHNNRKYVDHRYIDFNHDEIYLIDNFINN